MSHMNEIFENSEQELDWFPDEKEVLLRDVGQCQDTSDIKYRENLEGSMDEVFSSVYEKLCGYRMEMSSNLLFEYIEELNKKCEVIQSNMDCCNESEMIARIEQCLGENGCIIAMVDNDAWTSGEKEDSCFIDSGIRTILVTGIEDEQLKACDVANPGFDVTISVGDFTKLPGILLEVLK